MLAVFWRKVSTKTISALRSFKKPGEPPEETGNFIKGKSCSSQWSEICEMNILPGLPTFLSNEKLRIIHVLNQPLKIPRRLLTLRIASNPAILHKENFSSGEMSDQLLPQRNNINREIITLVKRWKSTQSSCEKDGVPKKSRGRIEDHRQSVESCAERMREKSNDDCHRISEISENCRKSCGNLLNHREYYRSIETSSPIRSDKPVSYNDRRACDSMKHEPRESVLIMCENWTCGKSAMKRKIYHKCKPKPCVHNIRETIRPPSHVSRDCERKSEGEMIKKDKPKRVESVHYARQHSETETSYLKKNCEKKTSSAKCQMSKPCSVSDANEQIKPDPPPPRYQHWSENPPFYCDAYSNKTVRTSPVKPSPMIFVPRKKSWISRTKGKAVASTLQDIQEARGKSTSKNGCDKTDAKAKITSRLPKSASERCIPDRAISFENKCAASLTLPTVNKTKPRVLQPFPKLTKSGDCRVEKPKEDFATSNVSDCSPGMTSFKHRLSKCLCVKEMWSISADRESSDIDADARSKQEAFPSICEKIKRQESSRPLKKEEGGRRKRLESSSGWTRDGQRYKIRLKIFQKGNGCLDPCLPRIIELRQSRGGKVRSILSGIADDTGELSPRLKSSCRPPGYCSPKRSIVETKSYPTKMNESRVMREKNLRKNPCKKHR